MKKIKVKKRLELNKETVTNLSQQDLKGIGGGTPWTTLGPCYPSFVSQCQCYTEQVTGCTGALSGCPVCVPN